MITEKKSIFRPFAALKYLFRKPHTFCFPFEQKPTAARDRGLHLNDHEACTGCGNCADICPNQAITMVEQPDVECKPGKKNELPQVDYGLCCFCGLCVDICPPGSLSLARDYIHIAPNTKSFLAYLPDTEKSGNESFVAPPAYSIMKASLAHRLPDNPGFASEMGLDDFDGPDETALLLGRVRDPLDEHPEEHRLLLGAQQPEHGVEEGEAVLDRIRVDLAPPLGLRAGLQLTDPLARLQDAGTDRYGAPRRPTRDLPVQ